MEKNSCHAGAYSFSSASVPGSRSGDGQLWRPCEKLKGNFSRPANLTPLLRMNQKRNTLVEQKESERGRESERKSETSCLEAPRLCNGAAAHARNRRSRLATIKRSICLYRKIRDVRPRSIFFILRGGASS